MRGTKLPQLVKVGFHSLRLPLLQNGGTIFLRGCYTAVFKNRNVALLKMAEQLELKCPFERIQTFLVLNEQELFDQVFSHKLIARDIICPKCGSTVGFNEKRFGYYCRKKFASKQCDTFRSARLVLKFLFRFVLFVRCLLDDLKHNTFLF